MTARILFFFLILGLSLQTTGCTQIGPTYQPLFVESSGKEAVADGTVSSDFLYAAAAQEIHEAARRWEAFLARHQDDEAGYEDGFHALRVEIALLELARLYYIMGRTDSADALLRTIDPLDVL